MSIGPLKISIMKKILILIVTISSFTISQAQEKCNKEAMHQGDKKASQQKNSGKERKLKMMQALGLSESQKSQMRSIHEEEKKKMEALSLQQTITVKEYNDKKTAIRNEMQTKRQAVLTKEQKDKIASIKAERENKKNEMYDKKMARMKEKLSLTEDQTKQMNALRQKTKADVESIKNNNKLNDQEKKTQIKSLIKNAKDAKMNILTKEQLIKALEHRKKKEAKDKSAIKK